MNGTGNVTKAGAGALTLNGIHPMSGQLNIVQGNLILNGVLGGNVDVSHGATFTANGGVAGSLSLAGSLFVTAPPQTTQTQSVLASGSHDLEGGSPYFTVGKDFTATDGSLLDFAIGPGDTPTILVGGFAALNGSHLNVSAPSIGTARSVSFLALAGQALSMQNTEVTTGDPNVVPVLKQDKNALYVTLLNLNVPLDRGGVPQPGVGVARDRRVQVRRDGRPGVRRPRVDGAQ